MRKEKKKIVPVDKTLKENTVETPMFSSIHIGDGDNKAKQNKKAKQNPKSQATVNNSLPVKEKMPVKSVPRKSITKIPISKKKSPSKETAKAMPKLDNLEPTEKSEGNSKSAKGKDSAVKKSLVKNDTPKSMKKTKISSDKRSKSTKSMPKANISQKRQNKPVIPIVSPKAKDSAA